jgi:L-arabinose isomerase
VDGWIEAARVAHVMAHNRMGLMGHYYCGMLDIYSDLTQQAAAFGGHMQIVEIDRLAEIRSSVKASDVDARLAEFKQTFDIQSDVSPDELKRAAKTSVALDALVDEYRLGSMAYFYESVEGHDHQDVITSVILGFSHLTANGVPVAGEYEVKNAQAMKIMDAFGVGGSFTEYYAMDYDDDIVLMGHDGPGHIAIAQGRTKVRPLEVYHGKVGKGLSVEMAVKHGPVTLLSVIQCRDGSVKLLCAEAQSEPGPIMEIGNTNSRYRFSIGARAFVNEWNRHGPAHHCAVGVGHIADRIAKLGELLGLDCIKVC